jgi:hypothetical protein
MDVLAFWQDNMQGAQNMYALQETEYRDRKARMQEPLLRASPALVV